MKDLNIYILNIIEQLEFYHILIEAVFNDFKIETIVFILVQNELFAENGIDIEKLSVFSNNSISKVCSIIKDL